VKKNDLRKVLRSKLNAQKAGSRRSRSLRIAKKLLRSGFFRKAHCVCFYVSTPTEVDTRFLIRRSLDLGKRVLLPRVKPGTRTLELFEIKSQALDLKKGSFGIFEPPANRCRRASFKEAELVVVPGLAFDRIKTRLGRGLGFYDRFLKRLPRKTKKIGLAFAFQNVPEILEEAHDEKVDLVLTD